MYVEFVGVPGVGKTTVAEEACILLEKSGIDCATRMNFFGPEEKRSHKSRWSLMHLPYLDLYALLLWLRLAYRRKMGVVKTLTRIHEYQKLRYQLALVGVQSVSVWDNGFVQWFSNHVLAEVLSERAVVDFIRKRLPKGTLLVFMDTPVDISFERMWGREARLRAMKRATMWTPDIAEIQEKQEAFTQSQHMQKKILDALARDGIATLILDGMKSPEENALLVYEAIEKRLSI